MFDYQRLIRLLYIVVDDRNVQTQKPSAYVKIAMENGPFIVDLPIINGDFQ